MRLRDIKHRRRRVGFGPATPAARPTAEALECRLFLSVNILTHHGDASNDGDNFAETVLTPSNVNSTDFGKAYSDTLDGQIYAQPLYVQNVDITRGSSVGIHSVLYVATMHDSLYALDANTGAVLWQDSFLNISNPTSLTATSGVTTVSSTDLQSTNVGPELGILATPAISLTTNLLYLNANTKEIRGSDSHYVQRLWAVNLADGSSAMTPAVIGDTIMNGTFSTYTGYKYVAGAIVDGSGNNTTPTTYPNTDGWASAPGGATVPVIAFNALLQMQRTAVSLADGNVYLGFASHGDNGPYYGWILGYSQTTLALTAAFVTTPTYEGIVGDRADYTAQGGIWMSGSAIATDGTNLYVVTGNGAFNPAASNFNAQGFPKDFDYGDSLLKLSVDTSSSSTNQNGNGWGLKVSDYFTPSNALVLNQKDLDLGSGGVLLLPDSLTDSAGNPMLVFGGKESRVYLLDRNNLGKFNYNYPTSSSPDPRLYDNVLGEYAGDGINGTANGIFNTASYYNGNFYIGQAHTTVDEFNVADFASGTVPPGTSYTPTPVQQTPAFTYPEPTFTVSANGSSNALLWGTNYTTSSLVAFNAANITASIYDSDTVSGDSFTDAVKFCVPTVANGMVYLGTTADTLVAFGLRSSYLTSNSAYFAAPTGLTVSASSPTNASLSWTSHSSLATEYRVDRSTDDSTWTPVAYVSNSATSYGDTSIVAYTKYYYRVVALSGAATTAYSNVFTFMPPLNLSGQNFYLRLAGPGTLDVWDATTATGSASLAVTLSQISSVSATITSAGGGVTVDFSQGDPLPSTGLIFTGASAKSALTIIGDSGNDVVTVNASSVTFGSTAISYTNAGAITFTGGTGSNVLTQSGVPGGGASVLFNNITAADTLDIAAGTYTFPAVAGNSITAESLGALAIGSAAKVTLASPAFHAGRLLLELGNLSIAGSSNNWTGQLDLTGNDLILHNSTATVAATSLATLTNELKTGYNINGSAWTGKGIMSSTAAATNNTALGIALGGTVLTSFDGQPLANTDVIIKYTYQGDANLSGNVSGSDYTLIDNGFNNKYTGWSNGDFNYDGVINGNDYTLLDNGFNSQTTPLLVTDLSSGSKKQASVTPLIRQLGPGTKPSLPAASLITMINSGPINIFSSNPYESITAEIFD